MKEKIMNSMEINISSELIAYGEIASIILGVALLFLGIYLKNKDKKWWVYVVLLGIVSILVNIMKLIF